MGALRFLFKLFCGLLFLAVFGLAVFSGTVLWKDEQLNFGNFFREFFSNVAMLFEKGRRSFEQNQQEWQSSSKGKLEGSTSEMSQQTKDLPQENREQLIAELEVLLNKAKGQLAKADPTQNDYQVQLQRTLRSFEAVQASAQKNLKSFSFKPDEQAKIESFLSESRKQIYWANKFLASP
jgi:hypothetical protein